VQTTLRRLGLVLAEEDCVAGASLRHAFTHFTLTLTPWRVRLPVLPTGVTDPLLRWVPYDELQGVGVPTPVRRILGAFQALR